MDVAYLCAQENFPKTMREVSALWRSMSEQEKDQYGQQPTGRQSQPSERSEAGGTRQRSRTPVSPF